VNNADTICNARRKRKDMKFKINNRTWSIEEKSQSEIKSIQNQRRANEEENIKSITPRYYGVTHCDIQEMYLDKDLPTDRKKATLIHELTHCYIDSYITHSEKEYSEEDVADIVSNSYDIIHEIVDEYFKGNKD
jgi:Zn-dependent peptidase ImmA (M78 family)